MHLLLLEYLEFKLKFIALFRYRSSFIVLAGICACLLGSFHGRTTTKPKFHGEIHQKCIADKLIVKLTAEKRVVPKRKAVVPISNYFYSTNSKAINFTIRYSAVG